MQVHSLHTYPVKSAQAINHDIISLSKYGFLGDRQYMVVSPETGKFITQRENPILATIGVRELNKMTIETQLVHKGRTVDITPMNHLSEDQKPITYKHHGGKEVLGFDVGNDVANFLQDILGEEARLIWHDRNFDRVFDERFNPTGENVGYADQSQYLITTIASLNALNEGLLDLEMAALTMDRFRANIVIDGDFEPFAEDHWEEIEISGEVFELAKPCTRCQIPATDQVTGERTDNGHAIKGLKHIGRQGRIIESGEVGVMFGMHAIGRFDPEKGFQYARSGDPVKVLKIRSSSLWSPKLKK